MQPEKYQDQTLLDSIVNNYTGFIYTVSRDYKVEFMNKTMKDSLGYDGTGENCFKLIHGRREKCPWCMGERVLAGETAHFEYQSPRDNRWYYYVSTPRRDENGRISAQQLIAIDIHDLKEKEKDLEKRDRMLLRENRRLRTTAISRYGLDSIIGQSLEMQRVYQLILEVADSDAAVIVHGESGTGKELTAKAIHNLGPIKAEPFLPVNCGGIPDTLIESEFFGYKKGAFTGAYIDKAGYLKLAEGGTLFLDEIGDIHLNMQVKLLRALDGEGYTPLGSSEVLKPRVRIICATNRDLNRLVHQGQMRLDFYYRINVVPIFLPPLRERRDDIPLLIYHFLKKFSGNGPLHHIPPSIMAALEQHDWPGNIRELQNIIHRYVTLNRLDVFEQFLSAPLPEADIDLAVLQTADPVRLQDATLKYEKSLILKCLERCQWNQSRAAQIMGINRKTLYSKIRKLNIRRSEKNPT